MENARSSAAHDKATGVNGEPVTADRPPLAGPRARLAAVFLLAALGIVLRYLAFVLLTGQYGPPAYLEMLCQRDCSWYASIVLDGYDAVSRAEGKANWAFFPLTPAVVSLLHDIPGLSVQLAGAIAGEAAIVVAAIVARPLFDADARAYWLFCVFILAGPFSYAYGIGMSEPFFFLLATLVFVGLERRSYGVAGVAAALLTATRVTGIFILIPMAMEALKRPGLAGEAPAGRPRRPSRLVLALGVAPVGLLSFMAYLQVKAGDALAFAHVQTAWGRGLGNPLGNLLDGLLLMHHGGYGLTMSLFALGGLLLAAVLAFRRDFGMALFVAASILLAMSTGVMSLPRFVAGLSPVSIAAAQLLSGGRLGTIAAVLASLVLCVVMTMMWLGGSPLLT